MTFIQINDTQWINAEIIALIESYNNKLSITTKNGKAYYITSPTLVERASDTLRLRG